MKKLYLSLFLFNFIILSPYTLNGMLTRSMRNIKAASSLRYNTNLTIDDIPSTLPQTFFQKLFGIKKPNQKYLEKKLEMIETIGSIIPLERLHAAAWERHNATNSPLAQKNWIRIYNATWRQRQKAKLLRDKLGLPSPYYKNQDNLLGDTNFCDDFYNNSHFFPENEELLNLKNETIAALINLNNSQSTSK